MTAAIETYICLNPGCGKLTSKQGICAHCGEALIESEKAKALLNKDLSELSAEQLAFLKTKLASDAFKNLEKKHEEAVFFQSAVTYRDAGQEAESKKGDENLFQKRQEASNHSSNDQSPSNKTK